MGGHEAPPGIISVFLGAYVDHALNCLEKGEKF
jgi:glutamine synthetase type III